MRPAPRWLAPGIAVVGVGLRWWNLGADTLTRDELYTGAVAGLPLSRISEYVANHDTHPPADYLVRHLVAGERSAWLLRAPSAVLASAFLALLWWWVRDRGWFAVVAVAVASANPFLVLYGRTARFYALMALLGLVVAFACDRWLVDGRRRWTLTIAIALLLALLTHYSAVFAVLGVLVLPGIRRDRKAWQLRAAVGAAVVGFVALWGGTFLDQRSKQITGWIPLTSFDSASRELGRLMSPFHPELGMVAVGIAGIGGWWLWRSERRLGRVAACVGLLPVVLLIVAGVREHVLAARSIAVAAWVVPFAVAAAMQGLSRRSNLGSVACGIAVGGAMAASLPMVYSWEEEATAAGRAMVASMRPGDGAVAPTGDDGFVFAWTVGTAFGEPDDEQLGVAAGVYAQVVPGADFSGRVWSYHPVGSAVPVPDSVPCPAEATDGPRWRGETMVLECLAIRPRSR